MAGGGRFGQEDGAQRHRRCIIQLLVLVLIAIIVGWLLRILLKEGRSRKGRKQSPPQGRLRGPFAGRPCPLCNTRLEEGQRVQSVIYPGTGDRIVEIYGCPNCHPRSGPPRTYRICPVCRQELSPTDYVVGRMFERAEGRKHLHVLGCTRCRKGA